LEHIGVRNLVSEHVHKLDASRFENWKIVQLRGICNLQFWHNQSLNVILKLFLVDADVRSAMSICVAADTSRDNQVNESRHLLPMSLLIRSVLLMHGSHDLYDELTDFLFKEAGELADKFHAVSTSRLRIRLLKVILDVLSRLIFVLFQVLLCHGNVWDD